MAISKNNVLEPTALYPVISNAETHLSSGPACCWNMQAIKILQQNLQNSLQTVFSGTQWIYVNNVTCLWNKHELNKLV